MYRKYILDTSYLKDPAKFTDDYFKVSPERQMKIDGLRTEQSKRQSLGAGILLNQAFEEYHINKPDVVYSKHGKPILKEPCGLYFNLSHSGDMVMCVWGDRIVGCDVQKLGEARLNVAKRTFCAEEYGELTKRKGSEQNEFFYQIWTRKESLSKAIGCGMSISFQKLKVWPKVDEKEVRNFCCIDAEAGDEIVNKLVNETGFEIEFEEFEQNGYQFCICVL